MAETQPKPHFRGKARRGRRLEVRYRLMSQGEAGAEQRASTLNIGVGGAFIQTDDPAPPGTRLTVRLPLDGGPALDVTAEVRWMVDSELDPVHGMGIKFLGLDGEQQRRLNDFFSALPDAAELEELA